MGRVRVVLRLHVNRPIHGLGGISKGKVSSALAGGGVWKHILLLLLLLMFNVQVVLRHACVDYLAVRGVGVQGSCLEVVVVVGAGIKALL